MGIDLAFYMLATARLAYGILYEDDPLNAGHQRSSDFTSVSELIFVEMQSKGINAMPIPMCQAMMKLRSLQGGSFNYIVYSAVGTPTTPLKAFVTTLTTGITGRQHRQHPNTIKFQTSEHGVYNTFKMMYADPVNGCFILVGFGGYNRRGAHSLIGCGPVLDVVVVSAAEDRGSRWRREPGQMMAEPTCTAWWLTSSGIAGGCRLLRTSSTVHLHIPQECARVYSSNCPPQDRRIYFPACGTRIPHIVNWNR
uniref:Putative secreted protein n=1 Tax=Amblyomma triste TaxID=251400 RepID=A0A023GA92_AMBTT